MDKGGNKKEHSTPNHIASDEEDKDLTEDVLLELVNQDQYAISYTFFIIPELPSFELGGDLVDKVPEWLGESCAQKGWKLEFVTVKPNYLQWAITVSTRVIASQVVIQVRTDLSKLILDTIDEPIDLKDPSDIWAHGYLLLHGLHQDTSGIIEQYIRLIREQQRDST